MKIKNILALTLLSSAFFSSCGPKDMDNYPWLVNNDATQEEQTGKGADDPEAMAKEMKGSLALILAPQEHKYQYQRANTVDVYAGYWTVTQNKFLYGGALPTTYTYPNDYLGGPAAIGGFPGLKNAYFYGEQLNRKYLKALAMIIYDYAMQEISDFYGPAPFDDWRAGKTLPPMKYQSQEEIYHKIFLELDEAIAILNETQPTSEQLAEVEGDKGGLSHGDWQNWVKFANSLRLRMALNIVKVAPEEAREQAEKAVNDPIGVFSDTDPYDFTQDRVYCDWVGNNPLTQISSGWDDLRLGASLENILKRYNSPLLGLWFEPCKNMVDAGGNSVGIFAGDDHIGVRQGIAMINKTDKTKGYGPFSESGSALTNMPLPWLKRTEMLFARAEGALRGWNMGGTAEDFYRRGIKLSFQENGLDAMAADEYLEQEVAKEVNYRDPYNEINSIAGRVKVGVKWDEDDSNEVKLEKIITQRWIAIFPASAEAWTTFRRTGYPRLFPVKINNWEGVDTELQLRRIPYVPNVNNRVDLEQLPALMNGQPNAGGSRLWWDVPTERREGVGDDGKTPLVIPVNF